MGLQSFYPVFANGQVLTSAHLNDIVTYLEPQDRLTRSQLSGIGIVCGLEPVWTGRALRLSGGVAVTSEGYLIAEDTVLLNRAVAYKVPVPEGGEAASRRDARYPFLFQHGKDQVPALELLPEGTLPVPGEQVVGPELLKGRCVMLFLERAQEDLKSCDINDCSDRGSQVNLTLRRLLIAREDAEAMLAMEQALSETPVQRAWHGRLDLAEAAIEKINPSGSGAVTLDALHARMLATATRALSQVAAGLDAAFDAYRPILSGMYPAALFPQGPVPAHHFVNLLAQAAANPLQMQSIHALAADMVEAHNEVLHAAALFDAECRPVAGRFPLHVLLGPAQRPQSAFDGAPRTAAEAAAYDPRAARGGAAPEGPPRPCRQYFVPSPALDAGNDRLAELKSLFARAVLLAQSFSLDGALTAPLRITPSRQPPASLGDRAIPAYLRFAEGDGDLLANWSWPKARRMLLGSVAAYARTPDDPALHPLRMRRDGDDFLRIEGHLGKPLGTVMAALFEQRQTLGLNFAVDPVYVDLSEKAEGDREAQQRALAAVGRLLLCRMRDLDMIFLMLMAGLFAFLVWLVQTLGRLDGIKAAAPQMALGPETAPAEAEIAAQPLPLGRLREVMAVRERAFAAGTPADLLQPLEALSGPALRLDAEAERVLKRTSEDTLDALRGGRIDRDGLALRLVADTEAPQSVARLYEKVRAEPGEAALQDKLRRVIRDSAGTGEAEATADTAYPAVALMARTEALMAEASAPTLAEFDAARFSDRLAGFTEAYGAYAERADLNAETAGEEAAKANRAIVASAPSVSATAARFGGGALGGELQKRLMQMFRDMTFPHYARRHPGLEHRGGVPVGGTFVLLYADRASLSDGLAATLRRVAPELDRAWSALAGSDGPGPDLKKTLAEVMASSLPQVEDALDNFVVLGDFCRPDKCCDGECGDDIVLDRIKGRARPKAVLGVLPEGSFTLDRLDREIPAARPRDDLAGVTIRPIIRRGPFDDYAPAVLRGTVQIETGEGVRPARWAVLRIVDAKTGHEDRRDRLREGHFNIELPPGDYEVQALAEDRESEVRTVALVAGLTERLDFVL